MLTNIDFVEQASYLAKNVSAWAGDALTLRERAIEPMDKNSLQRFLAYVRERLISLEQRAGITQMWRHKKRRSLHVVMGRAKAQCATGPIQEGDEVEVYVDLHDGKDIPQLWVRKVSEFHDGRFELADDI